MSAVDALYIYDLYAPTPALILSHTWRPRPSCPPATLLHHYQSHPTSPPPSLLHLPTTPPTLLFSTTHNNLLLLSPKTSEIEPLLVLEFLHRVLDVLEDYLSPPLLPSKLESNYDIIAQLLNEMADDGFPFNTEPNALRDVVLPHSLISKLLGTHQQLPQQLSTIPWRRSNVKHTNNELYVDVIELVTATIAPSGRPLAARSNGIIAFTSKLSGVPDLLMTLQGSVQNPVFHPCVRLSRWRDRPGELSFVPPDGKFVLASYEVDLLPNTKNQTLQLPVTVEMQTGLGQDKNEFEVRALVGTGGLGGARSGDKGGPVVEEVELVVPLPPAVKGLTATRCSKGEWNHEGREITWKAPVNGTATLRTGVVMKEGDVGGMPRCVRVRFAVKGWLASGVRVEGLRIVQHRGMGEGVKPYKGVKYLTKAGTVEVRCCAELGIK